ncbi:hypothetical protein B0H65DRAFT_276461 [Neurospora tetraspora]|uniref:Uncharacterized protein n=1 Tax=Neurospora tetraspora TaxID=94610 RepID=A0AAE0MPT3_9PEZI|nr:hypothetical protein B0H65DRAFT_276461 [Neurospora tetraspora]
MARPLRGIVRPAPRKGTSKGTSQWKASHATWQPLSLIAPIIPERLLLLVSHEPDFPVQKVNFSKGPTQNPWGITDFHRASIKANWTIKKATGTCLQSISANMSTFYLPVFPASWALLSHISRRWAKVHSCTEFIATPRVRGTSGIGTLTVQTPMCKPRPVFYQKQKEKGSLRIFIGSPCSFPTQLIINKKVDPGQSKVLLIISGAAGWQRQQQQQQQHSKRRRLSLSAKVGACH